MDGVLLLDKAKGKSSNHALQDARFLFQAQKAGHTGTLDPFATGMLVVCFGQANKYSRYLLDADKSYQFIIKLGEQTSTGDPEGEIITSQPISILTDNQLRQCEMAFTGAISQTPPNYSALKVNGRRAYELARKGEEFTLNSREVTITTLQLKQKANDLIYGQATVSKGTYIRVLVEDIAKWLGTVGYCLELRRLSVGGFDGTNQMHLIDSLREQGEAAELDNYLLPIDILCQQFPSIKIDNDLFQAFCLGQRRQMDYQDGIYRAYCDEFIGMVTVENNIIRPLRLLNTENPKL